MFCTPAEDPDDDLVIPTCKELQAYNDFIAELDRIKDTPGFVRDFGLDGFPFDLYPIDSPWLYQYMALSTQGPEYRFKKFVDNSVGTIFDLDDDRDECDASTLTSLLKVLNSDA